jgi:hypothetical protein
MQDHRFLKKQANRSLEWLTSRLSDFSPINHGRIDSFRLKAFAEFTLVYAGLVESNPRDLVAKLSGWRDFIINHCENPAYAQAARKQPLLAFAYLMPYLSLRGIGYRSDYHEETLRNLSRDKWLKSVELVPYRVLDREYVLWKSGFSRKEPSWRRLYLATAAGQSDDPLHFDDEAAYSLTHSIFYLTDFGNHCRVFSSTEISRVASLTECLLLYYWRSGFWDLVGELLITLNCLGGLKSAIVDGATSAFFRAHKNNGCIPAKTNLDDDRDGVVRPKQRRRDREFRDCYHTTLVSLMYCSTALNVNERRK